jgi:hypothetical protein
MGGEEEMCKKMIAVAMLMLTTVALNVHAADADKKKLEETVDRLLKAYNEGDAKTFNAEYAKPMAAVATDATFKLLYQDTAMKNLGKYVSKTPLDKETVVAGDIALLVFEAKFEKADKVKVSVNFMKDGEDLKVQQVRMDKM